MPTLFSYYISIAYRLILLFVKEVALGQEGSDRKRGLLSFTLYRVLTDFFN